MFNPARCAGWLLAIGLSLTALGAAPPDTTPAKGPAEARQPLPEVAAQRKAEAMVKEAFGDALAAARTAEEKSALAVKLAERAKATANDPAGRYALLRQAGALAMEAGDAVGAMAAAEAVGRYFAVEGLDERLRTVAPLARGVRTAGQSQSLVTAVADLVDDAVAADRYEVATQAVREAGAAAKRAGDADGDALLAARAADVRAIESAHQQVKRLLASPGVTLSPENVTALGRFRCLFKGDWEHGLPMLAQGKDAKLKALAEQDAQAAQPASTAEDQVKVGDAWWDFAASQTGLPKRRARQRAGHWYEQALPKLTGLAQARVEKRLREIAEETRLSQGGRKAPGAAFFQSVNAKDKFLSRKEDALVLSPERGSAVALRQVQGPVPGTVLLELAGSDGLLLVLVGNEPRLRKLAKDAKEQEVQRALYRVVPGLAPPERPGDKPGVSFESVARPKYYLRHFGDNLTLDPLGHGPTLAADSTWWLHESR